ncbi:MAG: lasso peptide biosynthesis B2 protein [Candidatus Acidiferrales bacterium]
MIEAWHRYRRLTGTDRTVVLEAAAALPAISIAIRLGGFRVCKAALKDSRARSNADANAAGTLEAAQRIARLEAATARNLFFRATCLEQSLVLRWLLRRRGMNADLRIGARKEADRFEAHAWVELNGAVLDGGDSEHLHFVPFKNIETSMETQTH